MGKNEGVSILDGMVAETLAAVGEKAPKRALTALPSERGADNPLPTTPASFPNDVPTEVVAQKVGELTRIIAHLTEARDALQLLIGLPDEVKPLDTQKAKEAAADAKAAASKRTLVAEAMADVQPEGFPERFSALAKEAQDATFTQPESASVDAATTPSAGVTPAASPTLWHCPVHPDATPQDATSPRGRQYHRCSVDGCKQFER